LNTDLKNLRALRAVRARREERTAGLRARYARECEQIRQQHDEARRASERFRQDVGQQQIGRWQTLFSAAFNDVAVLQACQQDIADAAAIVRADQQVAQLQDRVNQAAGQLQEATAAHAAATRKLEAASHLLTTRYRVHAASEERRSEAEQEDIWGARHFA